MKSRFLFAVMVITLFIGNASFATTHTIQVGAGNTFAFSPASMSAVLGDTIKWVWGSGTHTTTSDAAGIPAGAASWDNPINSGSTTFIYVPTVAGTYNYHCTFHQSMGMTGSFTVTSPTSVTNVAAGNNIFVSPNPAIGIINISVESPASVDLYNINGTLVRQLQQVAGAQSYRIDDIAEGTYLVQIRTSGAIFTEKLIIAR